MSKVALCTEGHKGYVVQVDHIFVLTPVCEIKKETDKPIGCNFGDEDNGEIEYTFTMITDSGYIMRFVSTDKFGLDMDYATIKSYMN